MANARIRGAAFLGPCRGLLGQYLRGLLRRPRVRHHNCPEPTPLAKGRDGARLDDHLPTHTAKPSKPISARRIIIVLLLLSHILKSTQHPHIPRPQTRKLHPNRRPRPQRPRRRQTRRLLHHHRPQDRNGPNGPPPALQNDHMLALGVRAHFFQRLDRCAVELRAGVRDRYGELVVEAVHGIL